MTAVLFAGNSYTFYEEMPAQVGRLAADAGAPLAIEVIAEGGASFLDHVERLGTVARIARGGLDVVVLQDQSGGPLHDRARFDRYGSVLAEAARAAGARIVWYETWARAEGHEAYTTGRSWSGGAPDEMTRRVRAAYEAMRARFGGVLAPVGEAFERARLARSGLERGIDVDVGVDSGIDLYDVDQHHASACGSHLAALVFAHVLAGARPVAARFVPPGVTEDQAVVLRRLAAATLDEEKTPKGAR